MLNTGVYTIRNKVNGKVYVGSTGSGFTKRWRQHTSNLRLGTHRNVKLQRAWNKYGSKVFLFSVIERCSSECCVEREQHWIDKLNSCVGGYNISPASGAPRGYKFTEEQRKRLSEALTGRRFSEEHKAKLSALTKERWKDDHYREGVTSKIREAANRPEMKEEASRRFKKMWQNDKIRERMRDAHVGSKRSAEARAKIAVAAQRRSSDPEWRRKQSERMKDLMCDPDRRAAVSRVHKGKKLSQSHIKAIRRANTGRSMSSEAKAKLSKSLREAKAIPNLQLCIGGPKMKGNKKSPAS
jgi:group I intron endonuclease